MPSTKGQGLTQPLVPHEPWHVDIAYLNIASTFYPVCSVLDGGSRFIVHWELREQMTELDVELTVQRAREQYSPPGPHHLRQRPAIHRARPLGISSRGEHDPRPHLALLPTVEWQDRASACLVSSRGPPAAPIEFPIPHASRPDQ